MSVQDKAGVIKCLVFDFDGVLADSNAIKHNAYFDIFAPLGAVRPIINIILGGNGDGDRFQVIERILRRLMEKGFLDPNYTIADAIERYADQYNHICESYASSCREISGVSKCLPRLASRFALYVNSDTPEEPLRRIIYRRGWRGYFKDIFGRPRTKVENLRVILEHEEIDGSGVVFVGDSRRDFHAARQRGCHFIGLRSDGNNFDDKEVFMVEEFSHLEEAVLKRLE